MRKHLLHIINTAYKAGKETLRIYNTDFDYIKKEDNSPLTEADKQSNEIIVNNLQMLDYPILSEEGAKIDYSERKKWQKLWIVDPLDGTKEFIKRNGEFTINIAFVENEIPILGVIYVPVLDIMYFAEKQTGSYICYNFSDNDYNSIEDLIEKSKRLETNKLETVKTIVGSRSHMNEATKQYIEQKKKQFLNIEMISRGSSLKLCMVAESKAELYPRFAPTMEWDVAAGHAIVKYAGGLVINAITKKELVYNKENLLNPFFIVASNSLVI